jgi:Ca2+/Na+ antiporter
LALPTSSPRFSENIVETPNHLLLMTPHFNTRQGNSRKARARRNKFFLRYLFSSSNYRTVDDAITRTASANDGDVELAEQHNIGKTFIISTGDEDVLVNHEEGSLSLSSEESGKSLPNSWQGGNRSSLNKITDSLSLPGDSDNTGQTQRRRCRAKGKAKIVAEMPDMARNKVKSDDDAPNQDSAQEEPPERCMSLRIGIVWLFIITLCVSAMSDIMVDTIDGFAFRLHLSEVFTSMVIVPFFSNVAEQVSAILFAYRNEMDLCVGVTVGSAIQIATFVTPGCVVIGMFVDRSMSLYFRGYETCCLFLAVVTVAAVLQGGTTNWLVGMTLICIYTMIATGFWFHEIEDLSTDAELLFQNRTIRVMTSVYNQ